MSSLYADAQTLREKFSFLESLGFKVTREESLNYGAYVEFKGNGIKIYLGFDFKSYSFSFDIYKHEDLRYSDSAYGKEIIPFCSLAKAYDTNYNCNALQPNKQDGYDSALANNVSLLQRFGDKILAGQDWI